MSVSRVFRVGMLCFLGGTATGLFFSWSLGIVLVLCAGVFAVVAVWFPERFFLALLCGSLFIFLSSGAWFRSAWVASVWETLPEISATLDRALVIDPVEQKENSKQVVLQPLSCRDSPCPKQDVLGIFPPFADIAEGDILSVSCPLERPERFTPDFDYPKVLAKDGIGYACRFPKEWEKTGVSDAVFSTMIRATRARIERSIESALPEPESGLIAGLLIGGNGRLPKNIQDEFSRTGLSHIVAVSGYNVAIVAVILMSALVFFGLYRQQAFWGALLGIFFFTILVGAPASAVRAAVMASVGLGATQIGRLGNPINAILFAASGMLLINPLLLRYDIGFQLSFAATLGIFLMTPFALASLRAGDIVATTIAAELFVLPIILFHFHAFPVLSLPANVLVLPLVPFAMLLGSVAVFLGMIFSSLAALFGFPAFLVSHMILALIEFFAARKFASVSVPSFDLSLVVVWYTVLFFAILFLRRRFPLIESRL